jgi:hypothetical protein
VRLLACGGQHPRPQALGHGHDALLALPELPRPVLPVALLLGSHELESEQGHHPRRVRVAAQLGQRAALSTNDGGFEQQAGSQYAQGLLLVLHIFVVVIIAIRVRMVISVIDEEPPNERPADDVVELRVEMCDGRPEEGRCCLAEMNIHLVSALARPTLRCQRVFWPCESHARAQPSAARAPGGQHVHTACNDLFPEV